MPLLTVFVLAASCVGATPDPLDLESDGWLLVVPVVLAFVHDLSYIIEAMFRPRSKKPAAVSTKNSCTSGGSPPSNVKKRIAPSPSVVKGLGSEPLTKVARSTANRDGPGEMTLVINPAGESGDLLHDNFNASIVSQVQLLDKGGRPKFFQYERDLCRLASGA